jgi:hypothetical protein
MVQSFVLSSWYGGYNNRLMCDLRSVGPFCGSKYHKKDQLHYGAIGGRYAY